MSHKFKIGQNVKPVGPTYGAGKGAIDSLFEVVRLMPDDRAGEPTYRIRSASGERAVREGDLILAS